jgi:hypothetical protein
VNDVKQATQKAEQYLTNLIPGATNIVLEEVELTEDERYWFITLSYDDPEEGKSVRNIFGKTVKMFKIRRDDGEVMAMKIRSV